MYRKSPQKSSSYPCKIPKNKALVGIGNRVSWRYRHRQTRRYGVDIHARVVAYAYNAITQKYEHVVIGSVAPTLGQSFSSQFPESETAIETTKSDLESAIESTTTLLTTRWAGMS
jgi:hypothetical protein